MLITGEAVHVWGQGQGKSLYLLDSIAVKNLKLLYSYSKQYSLLKKYTTKLPPFALSEDSVPASETTANVFHLHSPGLPSPQPHTEGDPVPGNGPDLVITMTNFYLSASLAWGSILGP